MGQLAEQEGGEGRVRVLGPCLGMRASLVHRPQPPRGDWRLHSSLLRQPFMHFQRLPAGRNRAGRDPLGGQAQTSHRRSSATARTRAA